MVGHVWARLGGSVSGLYAAPFPITLTPPKEPHFSSDSFPTPHFRSLTNQIIALKVLDYTYAKIEVQLMVFSAKTLYLKHNLPLHTPA